MNFRTLDLNLLRAFDAVMRERNITRAAAVLAMTQPGVSNAMRRFREAIGEDLFVPGPMGVAPTAQALALWGPVRKALAELREVFDPQRFDPEHDDHGFTLLMADATAAVVLPPLSRQLAHTASKVALRLEPLTTRDPRATLDRGAADMAVGFFPDVTRALAASAGESEFAHDPLYHSDYVCVMRREHPLAADGALTLDSYCQAQHLRVNFSGRTHGFVDEALTRLGRSRHIALTLSQWATAAQVLPGGDLLSVFSSRYVDACGLTEVLAVRPMPHQLDLPRIAINMLWHHRHERDAAHRWLRQSMAASLLA